MMQRRCVGRRHAPTEDVASSARSCRSCPCPSANLRVIILIDEFCGSDKYLAMGNIRRFPVLDGNTAFHAEL